MQHVSIKARNLKCSSCNNVHAFYRPSLQGARNRFIYFNMNQLSQLGGSCYQGWKAVVTTKKCNSLGGHLSSTYWNLIETYMVIMGHRVLPNAYNTTFWLLNKEGFKRVGSLQSYIFNLIFILYVWAQPYFKKTHIQQRWTFHILAFTSTRWAL